MDLTEYF